jgi:ABC-type phosphate/phosphonate transport system substrate-binding protein
MTHISAGIGGQRIAALPLYDFPELASATDRLWRAIAKRLKDAKLGGIPFSLTRSEDYAAAWNDPALLFGQACGYQLMKNFRGAAQIVGTPIYLSPGCEGPRHCSFFVTSANSGYKTLKELRGRVCAINGLDSNTGMNLLRAGIAPLAEGRAFFGSIILTGSHRASFKAVGNGYADLAAIDCVSFAHFQRYEPALASRIVQIGRSVMTLAPPFITARKTDNATVAILRETLTNLFADSELYAVREALSLGGFEVLPENDYEFTLRIEDAAAAHSYPELR